MEHPEASREQVALAEEVIRADFQAALDDLLRQRGLTRPLSTDDSAIWGFADAAVRRYHDATADDPALPRPSKVQLWEIRQRLYVMHGPLGPLGDLLAIEGVEDIHINDALAAVTDTLRREAKKLGIEFRNPYIYAEGDGEDPNHPLPEGWADLLEEQ